MADSQRRGCTCRWALSATNTVWRADILGEAIATAEEWLARVWLWRSPQKGLKCHKLREKYERKGSTAEKIACSTA